MSLTPRSRSVKPGFLIISLFVLLNACNPAAFSPVNVGREYGNAKLPLMVSHLPKGNQWVLSRTGYHYPWRHVLCFGYTCRRMIGKRKALKAISFEDFKKRVAKNARKGEYKDLKPIAPPKKAKRDTVRRDTVKIIPEKIAPLVVTPAVAAPILKADSLITLNDLLFETNSYKLKGEHYAALDSLGKFLTTHPTLEVFVSGHTDDTGNERHNVALSTKRAEAVADYLVDKGATYERITFEGFGSSQPIRENTTEEGRRKNRRVEILLKNPKK